MKYIFITPDKIDYFEANIISIPEVLEKLGFQDIKRIGISSRHFSHQRTVILRDLSGVKLGKPILGVTRNGFAIRGEFILCSTHVININEWELCGMSVERCEIAMREITLAPLERNQFK